MKQKTIVEYADNGIIVKYDDGAIEVKESSSSDSFLEQDDLTNDQKTIGLQYGGIIANIINGFPQGTLDCAYGYKINIEITPILDDRKLTFRKSCCEK